MKILALGQVENDDILKEIEKQTIQPSHISLYKDPNPAQGIENRRLKIAKNHDKLKDYVRFYNPDLVWQIEGDCELPADCLERLIEDYEKLDNDNFGYVSGIQVGRHGLYCLGAWKNFTENSFESLDFQLEGIQQVQATGFYCLLAKKDAWLSATPSWSGEPYGPDVTWGLSMSYNKYCDMDIHIGHKTKRGVILPSHISTCNARFYKQEGRWEYKQTT
jgi:hypothetical protein